MWVFTVCYKKGEHRNSHRVLLVPRDLVCPPVVR